MAANGYRLKIVTGESEFEAEGDKPFVLDMLKRFGPQLVVPSLQASKHSGEK